MSAAARQRPARALPLSTQALALVLHGSAQSLEVRAVVVVDRQSEGPVASVAVSVACRSHARAVDDHAATLDQNLDTRHEEASERHSTVFRGK